MPIILNTWSTLIITTLSPFNAKLFSFTDESLQALINQSEAEQEIIRTLLIEGIIDRLKIRDKQQFVQVNQAILIRLLDKLRSYKQNQKVVDNIRSLYGVNIE